MFIEQKIEALHERIASLESRHDAVATALREHEHRIRNELMKISTRSGVSPEVLAQLLEAVARNLYVGTPPPATNGAARDDGAPTNKHPIQPAQKGDALAGSPVETAAQAADGGTGSDEVVALPGEASASPAVDEPPTPAEKDVLAMVRVDGKIVHGPRASVIVSSTQAAIVNALLEGPKTLDSLTAIAGEKLPRMTVLKMANMSMTLRDAGLEIKVRHGLHTIVLSKHARV